MALNIDHSEEEQVEALKRWWKNYGPSLIVGVMLGGALIAGNKWWQSHKMEQAEAGSTAYATFLKAYEAKNNSEARKLGESLLKDHASSSYSDLARLILARMAFDKGQADEARKHLQEVMENTYDSGLKNTARLRLARLLESEGRLDQALATITDISDTGGFEADYAELKGDIMLAKGNTDEARKSYTDAVAKAGNAEYSRILKMKLANVGTR